MMAMNSGVGERPMLDPNETDRADDGPQEKHEDPEPQWGASLLESGP